MYIFLSIFYLFFSARSVNYCQQYGCVCWIFGHTASCNIVFVALPFPAALSFLASCLFLSCCLFLILIFVFLLPLPNSWCCHLLIIFRLPLLLIFFCCLFRCFFFCCLSLILFLVSSSILTLSVASSSFCCLFLTLSVTVSSFF